MRGGLKLKGGSKPSGGIEKKKKKKKTKPLDEPSSSSKKTALEAALEDENAQSAEAPASKEGEELDEAQLRELEGRDGDGKTASERAQEEMRRRRVSSISFLSLLFGPRGKCAY